jgi:hypothetical protein
LSSDVCHVKEQLAILNRTYDLPSIVSEVLDQKHLNGGLFDFMSFVKDECSRQEMT